MTGSAKLLIAASERGKRIYRLAFTNDIVFPATSEDVAKIKVRGIKIVTDKIRLKINIENSTVKTYK